MTQTLSIVIPVYNGAETVGGLVRELFRHLEEHIHLEIVLVNDGSSDGSWEKLRELYKSHPESVVAVNLAKNFGEHNAVMAGYNFATGDYVVNIDDDFQNPPREILKLLDAIRSRGYHVVYGRYESKQHSLFRNLGSYLTDKVANLMLKKPKHLYLCSFRILSGPFLRELIRYTGPYPYIDGLILRSTRNIGEVTVAHRPRKQGRSGYTLIKLLRLWSHVFLNFSIIPLRISIGIGLLFSLAGFVGAVAVIAEKLMYPEIQVGWASLTTIVLTVSGIQLLVMGLIGEYVGRIFISENRTPQFVSLEVLDGRSKASSEKE